MSTVCVIIQAREQSHSIECMSSRHKGAGLSCGTVELVHIEGTESRVELLVSRSHTCERSNDIEEAQTEMRQLRFRHHLATLGLGLPLVAALTLGAGFHQYLPKVP